MSAQSPVTGSLFAPFFFPLGIAFMGAQSAVMMKMAGENWQYGKRRISAMTNEEFNKMTPLKLYQVETSDLRAMIPSIESSLQSMTPLTATIVTEMLNTFKVGAQATAAYVQDLISQSGILGQVVLAAIKIWMPWLIPILDNFPDLSPTDTTKPLPPVTIPPRAPPTPERPPLINPVLESYASLNIPASIVAPGTTRSQLLLLHKNWEDRIRALQLKITSLKKGTRQDAIVQRTIINNENLLKTYLKVFVVIKKALQWVLANNKPIP